ncbi:ECF transporter S component [Paenibacillus dendrobii]|uniref:ECF transporter S component n=1 Tax=Paenibacillus dendrobii TaxID=2691084 RepID=UPI0019217A16|nr:ECF transporter S component [Paenibacillus dendrobii]
MQGNEPASKRLSRRTLWAAIFILVLIPATILLGVYVLNDRKYYFISLLIVLYTMVPFALVFEQRKPQARELIVIAVLTAIAVAGRGAFFMLPQFKPVVAIVIIAGVSLGAEAGFLVGAMTGFVSNFFFGQGPWTPWQMFCFGIIGFLAGILFKKGWLRKSKLSLCIYGGLATFVIYGGIINVGSLLMFTPEFSWPALLATYISGFWFDMVHAISTVFFLFIISRPMIEKLDRIKTKYGLIEP